MNQTGEPPGRSRANDYQGQGYRGQGLAGKRDYAAEYQRRKARAAARGTTPGKERAARRAIEDKPRDYQREKWITDRHAREQGYLDAKERKAYRATGGEETPKGIEAWRRSNILAKFGLTKRQFDRIRQENRNHVDWYGRTHFNDINNYNIAYDMDIHDWSEQRVGYIVSFHGAIVNPETNYDSLQSSHKDKNGKRVRIRKTTRNGKPLSNAEQFFYLVKYTGLMTVNEFEQRYGNRAVSEARSQGHPEP